MRYYKNLIKRKRYSAISIILFFSILGLAVIYFNSIGLIIDGIKESDLSTVAVTNNGLIGLLGTTNLGLVFIGIITAYFGLIFCPRNAYGSQDDSDYIVESRGDMIYIKYKDREFLVKKETFSPTDLFFKDKNKKFVSLTLGYQIYNYVNMSYKNLTEKEIDNNKVIKAEEIYTKFSDVHIMTEEDKQKYLKYKKIKNKISPFFLILTMILGAVTAFFMLGVISFLFLEKMEGENILTIIVATIMTFISYLLTKQSYKACVKNKKTTKLIMSNNMYYVSCCSYDKKTVTSQDTDGYVNVDYYIKVTNNDFIFDRWLKVPKDIYLSNEIINVWLVLDETGNNTLEIVGLVSK